MLKESKEDVVEPLEIREDELLMVHTQEYLNSLKVSPTHFSLHTIIPAISNVVNVCGFSRCRIVLKEDTIETP